MNKKLLLLIALLGCPLPPPEVIPPTPAPTPTTTIGAPPLVNTCASVRPQPCAKVQWGDGKGGVLWKASETQKGQFAFLLPGHQLNQEAVLVCSGDGCVKLPFAGCANPDGIGLRAHYKGEVKLPKEQPWVVKWNTCKLKILNKERTD